jgi:type VI secretion system protein VasD
MKTVKGLACLFVLMLLAGCAELRTSMTTTQNVNPDITGQPSPIVLKIYQLNDQTVFNQSSFFALFDAPQTTLGADLLSEQEVVLAPASSQNLWIPLNPQTAYVGFVAGYRDLTKATWRQVLTIDPSSSHPIGVSVDVSLSASGVVLDGGTSS